MNIGFITFVCEQKRRVIFYLERDSAGERKWCSEALQTSEIGTTVFALL